MSSGRSHENSIPGMTDFQGVAMMKEDIRQMRSFPKPPHSVKIVVKAVLLLLEQDELTTSEWRRCQSLMNPTKKFNVLKKIETFDIRNVHLDVITRTRQLLNMMSPEQLYASSTEAYSLYAWASSVIEGHEQINGKAASIDFQRQLFGKPPRNALPRPGHS